MELKIEIINNFKDFLSLENNWNNVLEQSQSDSVFLTFEWLKSWWLGFGKDKKFFIILAKDRNDLIMAIAPLMLSRSKCCGMPVKKISFIYNDNASCADFLIRREGEIILNTVIDYLNANRDKWDVIELQNIPNESPNYEILQDILRKKYMLSGIKEGLRSPFLPIESDWQTYLSNRSRRFRKTTKNLSNRVIKSGHYSIGKNENSNANKDILNTIFEIASKSWKAKYNTNNDENRKFLEELCHAAGEQYWFYIWILKINDKPVAYEYDLRYKNKVYALRADFNEEYKHMSPGSILHTYIVKHYFEDNLKEYDLCGHDDAYKKNWASQIRTHSSFFIYKNNFYGKALFLLDYKFVYHLKKFLKKFVFFRELKRVLMHRYRI